jgi:hypothetical protein
MFNLSHLEEAEKNDLAYSSGFAIQLICHLDSIARLMRSD